VQQGQHARLRDFAVTSSADCLDEQIEETVQRAVPNHDRDRLEYPYRDELGSVRQTDAARCEAETQQNE